jgi:hypothetical protein
MTALTRLPGGPIKRYSRWANGDSGSAFLASVGDVAGETCEPACDSGPAPAFGLLAEEFAGGFCCAQTGAENKQVAMTKLKQTITQPEEGF